MQGLVGLQQSLRDRAIHADLASKQGVALDELWSALMNGHYSIFDCFFTKGRCILVLTPATPTPRPQLDPRCRDALEGAILAAGQKAVAFDSGHSVSTVSTLCGRALKYVNIGTTYSKIPIAVVVFIYAAHELTKLRVARCSPLLDAGEELLVVGFPRPDAVLAELVSPAEAEVARLCLEGYSHRQIATERETSPRTVANQLAAVYAKTSVSGRVELLTKLTQHYDQTLVVPVTHQNGSSQRGLGSGSAIANSNDGSPVSAPAVTRRAVHPLRRTSHGSLLLLASRMARDGTRRPAQP